MDREATEVGDPVRIPRLEAHDAGPLAVGLDHEHPEHVGLLARALDVAEDALAIGRPRRGEERLHVLVLGEADEEVEVVRPHRRTTTLTRSPPVFARREARTRPDRATAAAEDQPSPMTMPPVIDSSRKSAP